VQCTDGATRKSLAAPGVSAKVTHEFSRFPEKSGKYVRTTFCESSTARGSQLVGDLNRYLSILKRLIFESSVEVGTPSLAAAPAGPDTRP
jgi:hypothetical protein